MTPFLCYLTLLFFCLFCLKLHIFPLYRSKGSEFSSVTFLRTAPTLSSVCHLPNQLAQTYITTSLTLSTTHSRSPSHSHTLTLIFQKFNLFLNSCGLASHFTPKYYWDSWTHPNHGRLKALHAACTPFQSPRPCHHATIDEHHTKGGALD